ncbi:type II toxin-antitoxin system RatA family toxin, partial [Rhizobium ruizarguesonis]
MPKFETHRPVPHTPEKMFDLVADVERYQEFLPLCEALAIRSRKER